MDEQEILLVVRRRVELDRQDHSVVCPPLSEAGLRESEARLGFRLPGLIRRLYVEVGNGGFGPGYGGLLGLTQGAADDSGLDAVARYCGWRSWQPDPGDYDLDPGDPIVAWEWPRALLAICHWGCAIYSCVDCTVEEAPVVRFRMDCYHPTLAVADLLTPESPSVAAWLEAWLSGELGFRLPEHR